MLNFALFSQYLRIINRTTSTVMIAVTYEACFAAICVHVLGPLHSLALQAVFYCQCVANLAYDGMTNPQHKDAPTVSGSATWLEIGALITFGAFFLVCVGFVYGVQMERMRRCDVLLRASAERLHASTEKLVHNFLPAAVLKAVNERSADGVRMDVVAWSFDPACLLQSDIVGFTALVRRGFLRNGGRCRGRLRRRRRTQAAMYEMFAMYAGAGDSAAPV